MGFPLTELPRGLTAALGIRDMGALPRELADQVGGSIDMLEMFLFNRREGLTGTDVAMVNGFQLFSGSVVPAGEAWFLWAAQATVATAVGESCTFALSIRFGGSGAVVSRYETFGASVNSGNVGALVYPVRWLAPGDALASVCTAVVGAPTRSFQMVISRLRI